MRALLVLVVATLSGCIFGGECKPDGLRVINELEDFAKLLPGESLNVAVTGCSTCDHASADAKWVSTGGGTGTIDLRLVPHCLVQDGTAQASVNQTDVMVDMNVKNCGDVVDYDAFVRNNSDIELPQMRIGITCASQSD